MNKDLLVFKTLEQINDGETIFIDGGSTMLALAKLLENKNVIIISNNLLLNDLNLKNLIMLNGNEVSETNIVIPKDLKSQINKLVINKAFFGFSSFKNNSFYTSSLSEAELKQELIKSAQHSFAVGDVNKTFAKKEYIFASLEDLKLIV